MDRLNKLATRTRTRGWLHLVLGLIALVTAQIVGLLVLI